jgi:hypothetical protein
MSEENLWDWLKGRLTRGHYSRVESGETSVGISDVYYRLPVASGWLELKFAHHPKALVPFDDKDGIRKSQLIWISEEVKFGGLVHIVAQVGNEILVIPGRFVRAFNGASKHRLRRMAVVRISRRDPAKALLRLKKAMEGEYML